MSISTGIFGRLARDNAVRTLVGQDGVFRDRATPGASLPYVVIQRVSQDATYYLGGTATFRNPIYQTASYAADADTRDALARAVYDCLNRYIGRLDEVACRGIFLESTVDLVDEEGGGSDEATYSTVQTWRIDALD